MQQNIIVDSKTIDGIVISVIFSSFKKPLPESEGFLSNYDYIICCDAMAVIYLYDHLDTYRNACKVVLRKQDYLFARLFKKERDLCEFGAKIGDDTLFNHRSFEGELVLIDNGQKVDLVTNGGTLSLQLKVNSEDPMDSHLVLEGSTIQAPSMRPDLFIGNELLNSITVLSTCREWEIFSLMEERLAGGKDLVFLISPVAHEAIKMPLLLHAEAPNRKKKALSIFDAKHNFEKYIKEGRLLILTALPATLLPLEKSNLIVVAEAWQKSLFGVNQCSFLDKGTEPLKFPSFPVQTKFPAGLFLQKATEQQFFFDPSELGSVRTSSLAISLAANNGPAKSGDLSGGSLLSMIKRVCLVKTPEDFLHDLFNSGYLDLNCYAVGDGSFIIKFSRIPGLEIIIGCHKVIIKCTGGKNLEKFERVIGLSPSQS